MSYAKIMKGFSKLAKKLNKYAEQTRKEVEDIETAITYQRIKMKDLKEEADKAQAAYSKLVKDYKLEV